MPLVSLAPYTRGMSQKTPMPKYIEDYRKRVEELAKDVSGNEQATKQALIGPLMTALGWDLTDPRVCMPEYKADFGTGRSSKPIDWAFIHEGKRVIFVEAKAAGKRLDNFDEQLKAYFAQDPGVRVGILTNGEQWKFFTDLDAANIMDAQPFATWEVISDKTPPLEVLTLLQKEGFDFGAVQQYAKGLRRQGQLILRLNELLSPPTEDFVRLCVGERAGRKIEERKLNANVVEEWAPRVSEALLEWAKEQAMRARLSQGLSEPSVLPPAIAEQSKIVTTEAELQTFDIIAGLLGSQMPVSMDDAVAYCKVHVANKRTWVIARMFLDRSSPAIVLPLTSERILELVPGLELTSQPGWTSIAIKSIDDVRALGPALVEAYRVVCA